MSVKEKTEDSARGELTILSGRTTQVRRGHTANNTGRAFGSGEQTRSDPWARAPWLQRGVWCVAAGDPGAPVDRRSRPVRV